MARPKKNIVQLTDAEAEQLKCVLQKNNTCQTLVNRCRVLLALDENHPPVRTYDECVALFCISRPTISHVAKTYVNDGLEAVLKIKRNVNSDNARRKVDGRMEAGIVEIACGPVPEGHSRWTIRLLEGQAKIEFDEPVSRVPYFAQQLVWLFIHADCWSGRVIRHLINVKNILHTCCKFCICLVWETP